MLNIKADFTNENVLLYNKDCRELLKNIGDESIDLFCSDIPYKIRTSGGGKKKQRQKVRWRDI